ncbi:type II secretion system protein GspM [Alteromonas facilis]|uniref:type II secretion system protein GspM n=1 Tax=Alteromonas facilis TaxID=2048004 RepID=UPI000C28E37D|nr:type II secretion system protein M [Alteromonas facilis]
MQSLIQRYKALTEREQWVLLLAAIVSVVGLFYLLVWSPLQTSIAQTKAQVENQQELLTWVKASSQRAIQLRRSSGGAQGFTGSLPQAVNQTTSRFNIVISRMQPQGDELQVWVDEAAFDSLVDWLNALENMGITILQVDLTEADSPGQIKLRRLQLGKS